MDESNITEILEENNIDEKDIIQIISTLGDKSEEEDLGDIVLKTVDVDNSEAKDWREKCSNTAKKISEDINV